MSTTGHTDTGEVILKDQRRRRWSPAEKAALVRRTDEPGMSVSLAQVSAPRRCGAQLVVPVEKAGSARRIDGRQRWGGGGAGLGTGCGSRRDRQAAAGAGQEDPGERNPQGSRGVYRCKKVDGALALVARGRPMKTVCRVLDVARSPVHDRQHRSEDWRDGPGRAVAAQDTPTAPVQPKARRHCDGGAPQRALVLRWAGNPVRLGADGDGHVRQGLRRPRSVRRARPGGQRAAW